MYVILQNSLKRGARPLIVMDCRLVWWQQRWSRLGLSVWSSEINGWAPMDLGRDNG